MPMPQPSQAGTGTAMPVLPRPLLRDSRFRRAWAAGALAQTMRWLEVILVSVFIFDLTQSAFQVALTLFLRMLPSFLFGALAGAVAERIDRRVLVLGGLAMLTLLWGTLGLLVASGEATAWHVTLGVFLNGMFWAMDFPVRRTMLGDIAGPERVGTAIALDSSTNNATRAIGPMLGGAMIETVGAGGAYLLGAAAFVTAFVLILSVPYRSGTGPRSGGMLANIRDGLRYVRGHRALKSALAVTILMNLFTFAYLSMVPVIGASVLRLEPMAIGILMAGEGLGAFVAALFIAIYARPRHYTRIYYFGSLLLVCCVLAFSLARSFPLSLTLLFMGGLGFAGFAAMQSTLVLSFAAPEYRARIMGVLAMCVGAGGPLGVLHIGVLAGWLGPTVAVSITAGEGLVTLIIAGVLWPELRRPTLPG